MKDWCGIVVVGRRGRGFISGKHVLSYEDSLEHGHKVGNGVGLVRNRRRYR